MTSALRCSQRAAVTYRVAILSVTSAADMGRTCSRSSKTELDPLTFVELSLADDAFESREMISAKLFKHLMKNVPITPSGLKIRKSLMMYSLLFSIASKQNKSEPHPRDSSSLLPCVSEKRSTCSVGGLPVQCSCTRGWTSWNCQDSLSGILHRKQRRLRISEVADVFSTLSSSS